MNGSTPKKIVKKLTSWTTLFITNTFMPTGGWISPSSTVITMMTPNQIGSKPSSWMTGKMIGTAEDDHGERVHETSEHEIHQHDQREHAVAAEAEAGKERRHLL